MIYVFAAYSIIWIALIAYTFTLAHRQKELAVEVERLEKALKGRSEGR